MANTKGASQYLSQKLLDHFTGVASYTAPTTVYLALFSVTPSEVGGGTEGTGASLARKSITAGGTNWNTATAASPSLSDNKTIIQFAAASATLSGGANQVAWGLFDDPSAGNLLFFGQLTTPKPVMVGDSPNVPIGDLDLIIGSTA